ncbi:MAG: integrase core domain-containing protein [Bacillota bacterium]
MNCFLKLVLEFTNRFSRKNSPTLFEAELKRLGIQHKLIRPFTPRHNGKVERSHRKDNERFYAVHKFHSFEDFKRQLYTHNWKYNNFPMRPLGWISPKQAIQNFFQQGVTHV